MHLPQIQAYGRLTAPAVRACIRANFREHTHAEPAQQGPLLDQVREGSNAPAVTIPRHAQDADSEDVRCIKSIFGALKGSSVVQALSGLQVMTVQLHLERCSSDTITEGVRVSVTSALLEVLSLHLSPRVHCVAPSCWWHTIRSRSCTSAG